VIQNAVNHVLGAGRSEVQGPHVLVAMYGERDCHAVHFLKEEGISRLDVLTAVSHGTSKLLPGAAHGDGEAGADEPGEEGPAKDPLEVYAVNLNESARKGEIDPLVGRHKEVERALHVLARRRKNNPLFRRRSGRGQDRHRRGHGGADRVRRGAEALRERRSIPSTWGRCWPARATAAISKSASRRSCARWKRKKNAVIFVDELHTIVGAGAVSGGSMDASNLLKPLLSSGRIRCIGTTTHKELRATSKKIARWREGSRPSRCPS
jgi:ATP-dependent Clp protease ATP-binding subunit ClpA